MSNPLEKIKSDPVYVKYKNILKELQSSSDLMKIKDEAEFLHRKKLSRKLHELRVSPQTLQDAIVNDFSNRSRLVELKVLILNQEELLSSTIDLTKKHLRVEYQEELLSFGATRDKQVMILDKILAKGLEFLSQLVAVGRELDLYLKDIDQTGYGLSNVKDTLVLFLKNKEVA